MRMSSGHSFPLPLNFSWMKLDFVLIVVGSIVLIVGHIWFDNHRVVMGGCGHLIYCFWVYSHFLETNWTLYGDSLIILIIWVGFRINNAIVYSTRWFFRWKSSLLILFAFECVIADWRLPFVYNHMSCIFVYHNWIFSAYFFRRSISFVFLSWCIGKGNPWKTAYSFSSWLLLHQRISYARVASFRRLNRRISKK